jgi:hypothetical protein
MVGMILHFGLVALSSWYICYTGLLPPGKFAECPAEGSAHLWGGILINARHVFQPEGLRQICETIAIH